MLRFVRTLLRYRPMIVALALRDLQSRYAGTLGGMLWAVAHPLATVVVFYFVFAIGFKAQGPSDTPFVLWFVCGLIPWFFFNDTLQAITSSVSGNPHLVKKTVFPTETLPFVHLISGLIPHFIFLAVLTAMLLFYGVDLHAGRWLFLYFCFAVCVLALGLGWLLSALQVFYRDVGQAMTMILQLWFWITPIVWTPGIMPERYRYLLDYNPMVYIVEGYRGALVYDRILWPDPRQSLFFWALALSLLILGVYVFHRLKPEFADVM